MAVEAESRAARARRPATNAKGAPLKQERAARTRDVVLNAAAEAFAARGYPGVTLLDVAELAGMTKGAVYFHFANKEALAVAVAQEFYRRVGAIADSVREQIATPLDAIAEFFARVAVAFRDDKVVSAGARLQIESVFIDTSLPVPYVENERLIAKLLDEALRRGQLAPGSVPQTVARVLIEAFFGAQHISWVLSGRADVEERVREVVEVVLAGCRARA